MALKQIVDKAIEPVGVVDIFAAAGLDKPEISILSDEFFAEVKVMKRKNLAIAVLQKLLKNEVRAKFSKNVIKNDKFSDMLADALQRYKNSTIEAAQVIEELIEIGKQIRKDLEITAENELNPDESAFYDALVDNGSAVAVMEDTQLQDLARILVNQVRKDATIDWRFKRSVQAKLRMNVKTILKKYGYPPDQQDLAAEKILMQSVLFANDWAGN